MTIYFMLINVPQCVCALSLGGATGIAVTLKKDACHVLMTHKAYFKIPFGDLFNSM